MSNFGKSGVETASTESCKQTDKIFSENFSHLSIYLFFFFAQWLQSYLSVTKCKLNTYRVASHTSLTLLVLTLQYDAKSKVYDIVTCNHNCPTV